MIIAITCTGARPEAFALCEKYMARQTVQPDLWLVVDDCDPATKCTMGQTIIRPEPRWPEFPEPNTQHRNLAAAIHFAMINGRSIEPQDKIIFFEDDDWYAPDYIQKQIWRFNSHDIVGETPAYYYHVKNRAFRIFDESEMSNPTPHASLCATAIRGSLLPLLIDALECRAWIDMYLWRKGSPMGNGLSNSGFTASGTASVVGIKGMPGRPGVSQCHRQEADGRWSGDPDLSRLRQWIGDDADAYKSFSGVQSKAVEDKQQSILGDDGLGFKSFIGHAGQKRYRCPDCGFDHWEPREVADHWMEQHKEESGPVGNTAYDEGADTVERKIHVPRN